MRCPGIQLNVDIKEASRFSLKVLALINSSFPFPGILSDTNEMVSDYSVEACYN